MRSKFIPLSLQKSRNETIKIAHFIFIFNSYTNIIIHFNSPIFITMRINHRLDNYLLLIFQFLFRWLKKGDSPAQTYSVNYFYMKRQNQ
jgi:hypothetical protein